jgi:hypothetical protein
VPGHPSDPEKEILYSPAGINNKLYALTGKPERTLRTTGKSPKVSCPSVLWRAQCWRESGSDVQMLVSLLPPFLGYRLRR